MSGDHGDAPQEPGRTWDGLEIATDRPVGSGVVVRRAHRGELQVLLLHRAHHGPDYEGDWAWTAPAGCRQPGESVYPAACRELDEEAGLRDLLPWAVDLSDRWAIFAIDVDEDTPIELVDPEHDRFEWVGVDEIRARVLPEIVTAQQLKSSLVPAATVLIRPMVESDLDHVVRWRRQPHVERWWGTPDSDDEAIRSHYRPRLAGIETLGKGDRVRMSVLEVDGRPVGFFQDYRVDDDDDYAVKTGKPDAIGFDYLIGDDSLVGRGIGTRAIWQFCRDVLRRDYPQATEFLASPSHRNAASLRALSKCGFERGLWIDMPATPGQPADTEIVCTLDVTHWFGLDQG